MGIVYNISSVTLDPETHSTPSFFWMLWSARVHPYLLRQISALCIVFILGSQSFPLSLEQRPSLPKAYRADLILKGNLAILLPLMTRAFVFSWTPHSPICYNVLGNYCCIK